MSKTEAKKEFTRLAAKVKELPVGSPQLKEALAEYNQFMDEHFDDVFDSYSEPRERG